MVTNQTGRLIEQIALSFAVPGNAISLYQYDAEGQNGYVVPVNSNSTFSGGSIKYSFYTVVKGGYKGTKRTVTYMIGTLTKY